MLIGLRGYRPGTRISTCSTGRKAARCAQIFEDQVSGVAMFERSLIQERTRAGMRAARARGAPPQGAECRPGPARPQADRWRRKPLRRRPLPQGRAGDAVSGAQEIGLRKDVTAIVGSYFVHCKNHN